MKRGAPWACTRREKRALNLLYRHLNAEQWETLGKHGYFDVAAKLRRWRLYRFRIYQSGMIFEHQRNSRRHWCIMSLEPGLPVWDWMLMVKLLIEGDLGRFLNTACKRGRWQPVVDELLVNG